MKLPAARFHLAEHKRNVYLIVPPEGTPFEAVLDAAYLGHVAARLRIGDRVEVMPEDGAYFGELLVTYVERQTAKVEVLRKIDLGAIDVPAEAPDFEIRFKGPQRQHSVVRVSDKSVVKDGFATKDAAGVWLASHLAALAR